MNGLDPHAPGQLGFAALLSAADSDNRARKFERETAHLPATMEEALPFYRILLRQHHAAMLGADVDEAIRLREEARKLALRLNGGEPGIIAEPDSPGNVLEREAAAPAGQAPLWGQAGRYVLDIDGMAVRIELEGMFGIGSTACYWPGFSAHTVEPGKPFLSQTGYRSFLGVHADPVCGLSPQELTGRVIRTYVARELKGMLLAIEDVYRERAGA